jgi:hypothetical protein
MPLEVQVDVSAPLVLKIVVSVPLELQVGFPATLILETDVFASGCFTTFRPTSDVSVHTELQMNASILLVLKLMFQYL